MTAEKHLARQVVGRHSRAQDPAPTSSRELRVAIQAVWGQRLSAGKCLSGWSSYSLANKQNNISRFQVGRSLDLRAWESCLTMPLLTPISSALNISPTRKYFPLLRRRNVEAIRANSSLAHQVHHQLYAQGPELAHGVLDTLPVPMGRDRGIDNSLHFLQLEVVQPVHFEVLQDHVESCGNLAVVSILYADLRDLQGVELWNLVLPITKSNPTLKKQRTVKLPQVAGWRTRKRLAPFMPDIKCSSLKVVGVTFGCSPPTKANRVRSRAGSLPDFRKWESYRMMPIVGVHSRGSPVSRALPFRRCYILTSFHHIRIVQNQQVVRESGPLGRQEIPHAVHDGNFADSLGNKLDSIILCAFEHQLVVHWLLLQLNPREGSTGLKVVRDVVSEKLEVQTHTHTRFGRRQAHSLTRERKSPRKFCNNCQLGAYNRCSFAFATTVGLLASHQGEPGSIPPGSPDFRKWESCRTMPLVGGFSRGSPVSSAPSFRCRSIFTSINLIGSQDLAVTSLPNLFTHPSLIFQFRCCKKGNFWWELYLKISYDSCDVVAYGEGFSGCMVQEATNDKIVCESVAASNIAQGNTMSVLVLASGLIKGYRGQRQRSRSLTFNMAVKMAHRTKMADDQVRMRSWIPYNDLAYPMPIKPIWLPLLCL
ncbi:hypothetical protein PR048_027332 [Dryococelus australis]|uniref:Uncharacterized protein n=1 Tax=Dryococelus australis TaxID=614101 RepID=A0ABQ9GF58_9NEOP|nr:hypothetical protein PR048_027332 [Dryococelus australis]